MLGFPSSYSFEDMTGLWASKLTADNCCVSNRIPPVHLFVVHYAHYYAHLDSVVMSQIKRATVRLTGNDMHIFTFYFFDCELQPASLATHFPIK